MTATAVAQQGGNGRDEREARARAKRMAWWLAALAVFFYVGYYAWMYFKGN